MTEWLADGDRSALWRPLDRAAVVLGNFAGLATLLAAYAGASHEAVPDKQIGWVELGIAGLLVVAVANAGWLLAGRRACWRLRHAVLPAEPGAAWPAATQPGAPQPGRVPRAGELVAGAVMTWYHSPSCRMVAGKDVTAATEAEHRSSGRRPCGVCLPDSAPPRGPA